MKWNFQTQYDRASIRDDERKLALALRKDMKFEDMKYALKRLFDRLIARNTHFETIVKQEAFYSKSKLKEPKLLSSYKKQKQ